ncbi:bifunctional PIG-L family deacetylase/class I SAM-dependent methyltransferase [Nesterenkonia sp. DZ6]|uniref:bifunctional PIG-L family deacetylase/class I SAM-dependent methyltransferase n=1 Tax=Nesterenkonia sp. DZ6 TaxID=2901229 RepID=UPI001F4CC0A7|nr:bifunctional PIG-L family deacetylase/class I SAM-dependent methyltransferase [Nesterenkonia sp. DZ6]MCH8560799.1 bifunctional PIG-L family deacetylase/class I SAM-dependent methyltransferase [Nesterenkonia sp. DZ6]
MTPGETPRTFHGAQAPHNTRAALVNYDADVPEWGIGEIDAAGRWIPQDLPGLLVVAPHPDDEVLGAAALIAAGLRSGSPVRVLAATDGTGSHPPSSIPADQLAEIRTAESEAALEELRGLTPGPRGPGSLQRIRLHLPDGELAAHREPLAEAIGAALQDMPGGTLLAAPLSRDGHPDHDTCGEVAVAAAAQRNAALVQYPVWLWLHSTPSDSTSEPGRPPEVPWTAARSIPIDPELAQVRGRAVAAFASQLGTEHGTPVDRNPGEPVLTPSMLDTVLRDQQIVFPGAPLDFEGLHARGSDPWGVTTRWYEQRKYGLTMAVLPRARYSRAFEPGCSIGGVTELLAQRCDEVLATDISGSALHVAAQRVVAENVTFRHASIEDWPAGRLDLIMISELAYYLSDSQWAAVLARASQTLESGGHLVSVHWRHPDAQAFRSAQQIRADLRAVPGWAVQGSYEDLDMLIDVLGPAGPSVAQTEFLH